MTLNDLIWVGQARFANLGTWMSADGSESYCTGGVALRYVNGQRRILIPWGRNCSYDPDVPWNNWTGKLAEYVVPSVLDHGSSTGYKGPTISAATSMGSPVRSWSNWYMGSGPNAFVEPVNHVRCAGLWWDEANHGVWYTMMSDYNGNNHPALGFTRLNDDGSCTKYGMWYYLDKDNPTATWWKTINGCFVQIPASARVGSLAGYSLAISGGYSSVTGCQHYGPGLHAIKLPNPLTFPAGSVIPATDRVLLADFTRTGPISYEQPYRLNCMERDADYTVRDYVLGSSPIPLNGKGRWQGIDMSHALVWLDGATKQGILGFGQRAVGNIWYGFHTDWFQNGVDESTIERTPDPINGWVSYTDPYNANKGYHSDDARSAVWILDPDHIREVALGTRSPYSAAHGAFTTYMKAVASPEWLVQWPTMAFSRYDAAYMAVNEHATGVYDATARQVLWLQCMIAGLGLCPALQVFDFPDAA